MMPSEVTEIELPRIQDLPEICSPMDMPVEAFRQGLQRRGENRRALMEWVRTNLAEGTDFGRIHVVAKTKCPLAAQDRVFECADLKHWSKPVLFQPGAQKICGMLGVFVSYPNMPKYEEAAINGVDLKHIILRCEIRDASGIMVGDGMGARSLAQDYGDLNKSLKMAAKSAQISATLRMAGLSEIFTQDLTGSDHEARASQGLDPRDKMPLIDRINERLAAAAKIPLGGAPIATASRDYMGELDALDSDDKIKEWYRSLPEEMKDTAIQEMTRVRRKELQKSDIERTKKALEAMTGQKIKA